MTEPLSEDERLKLLETIRASAPSHIDVDSLAAGELAGPVSPDRPPVPAWEYLDYLAAHPELSLDELSQFRFPILLHNGYTTVTSIAELIAPGPIPSTYHLTPQDVVRLYQLQHEAGALRWNADTRTHEEVKPLADYRADVYGRWHQELDAKSPRKYLPGHQD